MDRINYWGLAITIIFSVTISILFADYLRISIATYMVKEAVAEYSDSHSSTTFPELQQQQSITIVQSPKVKYIRSAPKRGYGTALQTCEFWKDRSNREPNNSKYRQYRIAACARSRSLQ